MSTYKLNIVLIGFMGCGKTTVGKELAKAMSMSIIDTDNIIESKASISIKNIFEIYGEQYFRNLEKKTISELIGIQNSIISVGGGAVVDEENFRTLKSIGTIVYLEASIDKLISNLKGDCSRPLLGNSIDKNKVESLLGKRRSIYEKADIIVNTDGMDAAQVKDKLLGILD